MRHALLSVAGVLVLLGAGCNPDQATTPAQAALEVVPVVGMELTLRESAFGWAGTLVEAMNADAGRRTVILQAWQADALEIAWSKGEQMGGVQVPQRMSTAGLQLPYQWGTEARERTALWLAPEVFAALAAGEAAHVNLGMFDDRLARGVASLDAFNKLLATIGQEPMATTEVDPTKMTPMPGRGTHTLLIDDVVTTVETINAGSWMGQVEVLNNPDFPLVLAVSLTPAAYGPEGALSPLQTLSTAGASYEVVAIGNPTK